MQTSYGWIFQKKTSVAAINITLGVPGCRAGKHKQAIKAPSKHVTVKPVLLRFIYRKTGVILRFWCF
jgi:hypothetical protein